MCVWPSTVELLREDERRRWLAEVGGMALGHPVCGGGGGGGERGGERERKWIGRGLGERKNREISFITLV